jgi:hypothetical protein
MNIFRPAPKPKKKRKGRAVRRNKGISMAARQRDGTCLYGLLYQDGCVTGYAPHHITSFGADPRQDVLENLICLCQKHHNDAEAHRIPAIKLRGILYHFYGYGLEDSTREILDEMKKSAGEYGLTSIFELDKDILHFKAVGFVSLFVRTYRWEEVLAPGFLETFDIDLAESQRVTSHDQTASQP